MINEKTQLPNVKIRQHYYIKNALLSFLLIAYKPFRKKNIWVFGCWEGNRYDDNAKFLFEYIRNNVPEIRPIWITKSQAIVDYIKSTGGEVYLASDKATRSILVQAGVAIYTNAIDDLGNLCYVASAKKVHLTHGGAGMKKSMYQINRVEDTRIKYALRLIKDKIYSSYKFDYIITTSKHTKAELIEMFNIKKNNRVLVTGFPRDDIFFQSYCTYTIPSFYEEKYKYILYLPTYRPYENTIVEDFLEIVTESEFDKFLVANNVKIIVKPHNVEVIKNSYKTTNNVIVLTPNEVASTQELLLFTDILISDYSTCCTDFVVKHKPILLYCPDIEKFSKFNGLTKYWEEIQDRYSSKDKDALINQIKAIIDNQKEMGVTDIISDYLFDESIKNTVFSKNVVEAIKSLI